jgi:lipopolysaccharide/colanic/teichoic acid biosynthesis glycosyltransferase
MNSPFIRLIDFLAALFGLIIGAPVLLIVCVLGLFDTGSPIFIQERVGKNRKPFKLIKFRTMSVATESVATHLVQASSITKLGAFLRKTKLDELPQLINVLKGEMSLVGPRPCLLSQDELIFARDSLSGFHVRPGITGLAQVNEVDMSTPELLAKVDSEMIKEFSIRMYFSLIFKTISGSGSGDRVKN